MSKALLWLVLLFALISMLNAQAIGPLSTITSADAPGACQSVPQGGTANIAGYGTAVGKFFASGELQSMSVALLALDISIDIIAIAYIVSRLFPHLGIRNWLQSEYIEVAKSAILIAAIYSLVAIMGNITLIIMGGSTSTNPTIVMSSLVRSAESYLCGINYNLMDIWDWIGLLGGGTGFWAGFQTGFYIPLPIPPFVTLYSGATWLPYANWALQTGNPFIGFYGSIIGDTINLVLFPASLLIIGLIDGLPSISLIGLSFFVPLGIIFRSFPFVRGIGGTMVAIGVGLGVILPSVLLVVNAPINSLLSSAVAFNPPPFSAAGISGLSARCPDILPVVGSIPVIGPVICGVYKNTIFTLFANSVELAEAAYYTAHDPPKDSPSNALQVTGANVYSNDAMYQFLNVLMPLDAYIVVQLLLTGIDIMVMFSVTDAIARSLGGGIRLQLGGKLRLAS